MLKIFNRKPKPYFTEVKKYLTKEYGVEVKKLKHKRSYKRLMMSNASRIEFLTFILEDGRSGRVLYSPFIKSFEDSLTKGISDEHLVVAYGGWLFLTSGLKDKFIEKNFKSKSQKNDYLTLKRANGVTNIKVVEQYKIAHSEIFVLEAKLDGYNIRCAGNVEIDICYEEGSDYYNVSTIYFLLGEQVFKGN